MLISLGEVGSVWGEDDEIIPFDLEGVFKTSSSGKGHVGLLVVTMVGIAFLLYSTFVISITSPKSDTNTTLIFEVTQIFQQLLSK